MPTFTYFDVRGRGFVSRATFVAAGADFEDKRITHEEWGALKATAPFGQLPLYEDKEVGVLAQSDAISRHVARKNNLYGKNLKEQAQVDQAYEEFNDILTAGLKALFGGDVEKLKSEDIPKHLGFVRKLLANNGNNGFLVGDSLTLADIQAFHILNNFVRGLDQSLLGDDLQAYIDGVRKSNDKLNQWLKSGKVAATTLPSFIPGLKVLNKPEFFTGEFDN